MVYANYIKQLNPVHNITEQISVCGISSIEQTVPKGKYKFGPRTCNFKKTQAINFSLIDLEHPDYQEITPWPIMTPDRCKLLEQPLHKIEAYQLNKKNTFASVLIAGPACSRCKHQLTCKGTNIDFLKVNSEFRIQKTNEERQRVTALDTFLNSIYSLFAEQINEITNVGYLNLNAMNIWAQKTQKRHIPFNFLQQEN